MAKGYYCTVLYRLPIRSACVKAGARRIQTRGVSLCDVQPSSAVSNTPQSLSWPTAKLGLGGHNAYDLRKTWRDLSP